MFYGLDVSSFGFTIKMQTPGVYSQFSEVYQKWELVVKLIPLEALFENLDLNICKEFGLDRRISSCRGLKMHNQKHNYSWMSQSKLNKHWLGQYKTQH